MNAGINIFNFTTEKEKIIIIKLTISYHFNALTSFLGYTNFGISCYRKTLQSGGWTALNFFYKIQSKQAPITGEIIENNIQEKLIISINRVIFSSKWLGTHIYKGQ